MTGTRDSDTANVANVVTAESLVERITRTLAALWPNDPIAPGLTISFLPSGDFYVSARRFPRKDPNAGVVVFRQRGTTLTEVLTVFAIQLDEAQERNRDGNGNRLRAASPRNLAVARSRARDAAADQFQGLSEEEDYS